MLLAADEYEQLLLDRRPTLHDLAVRSPHHEIAESQQLTIARTVALEVGVPLPTVELEHQSIADQQIHAPDARDGDLSPHPDPEAAQRQPRDGFDAGFGASVAEGEHAATPR